MHIPLPLPKSKNNQRPNPATMLKQSANMGLVFNKFVNQWTEENGEYGLHKNKSTWLRYFTTAPVGVQTDLDRANKGLETIAQQTKAGDNNPLIMRNTSRFVTGIGLSHPVENGLLLHHTLGVPYFPGSSSKGLSRAWAKEWRDVDPELVTALFGHERPDEAGQADLVQSTGVLIFLDALPLKPVKLIEEVLTPHDGGWRLNDLKDLTDKNLKSAPGDWHNPVPVYYLAVETGASYCFRLALRPGAFHEIQDKEERQTRRAQALAIGYQLLEEALEWIGIGAKTAIGFGRFENPEKIAEAEAEAKGGLVKGAWVRIKEAPGIKPKFVGVVAEIVDDNFKGRGFLKVQRAPDDPGKIPGLLNSDQVELVEKK